MNPTLVIMAAGMGSRYGGLKQIEPVGPNGEIIMEYSIYDAIRAGFNRVVFIIKKDFEQIFRERIGLKIENMIDTAYVFQDIVEVPAPFKAPEGRTKPWGTGHAVLSCKNTVQAPFAVINADDFYGASSFHMLAEFLQLNQNKMPFYRFCMVGFQLENTLTENGSVARGVCTIDQHHHLINIAERTRIEKFEAGAKYTEDGVIWVPLSGDTIVSMNTWGFSTGIFEALESGFTDFLLRNESNLLNPEYYLPSVVDELIKTNKAKVLVLPSRERWYGVTYRQDLEAVRSAVRRMVENHRYPWRLWGNF